MTWPKMQKYQRETQGIWKTWQYDPSKSQTTPRQWTIMIVKWIKSQRTEKNDYKNDQ
jgi:hypothetical protein